MIHCSAGIGRSGTFCIVDTALLLLERGERVNIKDLVLEMRRYRMGLIQTAEQLRFSYLAIMEGAEPFIKANGDANPSESEESLSEDDSSTSTEDSAEEVEEEDDVPCQVTNDSATIAQQADGIEGPDDAPPPIPPRGESLSSPGNKLKSFKNIEKKLKQQNQDFCFFFVKFFCYYLYVVLIF